MSSKSPFSRSSGSVMSGSTPPVKYSYYGQSSDEQYLNDIEKYKGSIYYDQLVNNPWLYKNNAPFSPNLIQQLGALFGDTSAEDAYYADLLNKRNQEMNRITALIDETKYNEPINQNARERAAGLNTDLLGVQGVGSAAENDQPIQPFSMPNQGSETIAPVKEIGNACLTFVNSMFSLATNIQGLQSNSFKLINDEIRNHKDAMDFAIESIAKAAPFRDINELDNADLNALSDIVLDASSKADYSHFSRRSRKLIQRTFNDYSTMLKSGKDTLGVASLKAELRNKFVQNQTAASRGAGQVGFSESFTDMVKFVGEKFASAEFELEQLALKYEKSAKESGISEYNYNKRYFDYASSQSLHKAAIDDEIQGHQASKEYNEAQAIINSTWDDVMKYLSKGDEWYNAFGVILASYIRSQSFHLPSVNISGPKSTTNVVNKDSHDYYEKRWNNN